MANNKIKLQPHVPYQSKVLDDFETEVIDRTDLTFEYATNRFKEKGLDFDVDALSLRDKDGRYNNVALLFSDQNPTISKFTMFQGTGVDIFLDKREFTGSILKQIDEVLHLVKLSNKKKVIISGKVDRDEYLDFPKRALREAILNCYCHQDYTLSEDIKVEFYDDRVEIFSPGYLPEGLTFDDMKKGLNAKRNKIIVDILHKLDLIENYTVGVRRIFREYENFNPQPQYDISNSGVVVTLFNRNYE